MMNCLDHIPCSRADSGEVMLTVNGTPRDGSIGIRRLVVIVAGTTWSPVVYEVTKCKFSNADDERAVQLALPFDVCICHTGSKVAEIAFETSAEFVMRLEANFAIMNLASLTYKVVLGQGGSLLWSKVVQVDEVGSLWSEAQRFPLLQAELAEKRAVRKDAGGLDKLVNRRTRLPQPRPGVPLSWREGGRGGKASGTNGDGTGAGTSGNVQPPPPGGQQGPCATFATPGGDANQDQPIDGAPPQDNVASAGELDMADDEFADFSGSDFDELLDTYAEEEARHGQGVNDDLPTEGLQGAPDVPADRGEIEHAVENMAEVLGDEGLQAANVDQVEPEVSAANAEAQ